MIRRRTVDVICMVDIEQSPASFHAHAVPRGIDIRPGDLVLVHDAPSHVGFGGHVSVLCHATVTRAFWLQRLWTRALGLLALTELYEVGFSPKGTP
jgi:hypothetical protein